MTLKVNVKIKVTIGSHVKLVQIVFEPVIIVFVQQPEKERGLTILVALLVK